MSIELATTLHLGVCGSSLLFCDWRGPHCVCEQNFVATSNIHSFIHSSIHPSIHSFREKLSDFRSCWIVFIYIVRGRPGDLPQFSKGKLLRSSWHLNSTWKTLVSSHLSKVHLQVAVCITVAKTSQCRPHGPVCIMCVYLCQVKRRRIITALITRQQWS